MNYNTFKPLFFFVVLLIFSTYHVFGQNREFYQLKIYSFESDDQMTITENYLEKAYLPSLRKLQITNIGVFKPREDSIKKIYMLIPFASLEQFEAIENKIQNDTAHIKNGVAYLNASHEAPPYQRVESILLKAFIDMPQMEASTLEGQRKDRVYELRSYESPTESFYKNKVDMFNAGGEVKLFKKLEFNAVFYGEVLTGANMPNLMYMTTFSDRKSRDAHWKTFVDAPEWKSLKSMSKYQNNVSHIDIFLLYPTEYSDY